MKKMLKKSFLLCVVGVLALSFTACVKQTETDKLVVGTSADYPPYEWHIMQNGEDKIVGFDIDIAQEIAKDMGKELEIKDMNFSSLLGALEAGKVDLVLAGMTPDDEKKKNADFSDIYYTAEQGVIIRLEDKDKYKTVDDFQSVKVSVQQGTSQEKIAAEQLKGCQLKTLTKVGDLILDLKAKKCDAIVLELPVAKAYVEENPDLIISEVQVIDEVGGSAAAVKKGNTELLEQVNKTLKRLADEGKIDEFVANAIKLSSGISE
ncbi:amino acid ABC transporter substrate-binding protein, PAAT family (TC 3.A.1.3.-) [Lutispora thermophila DSM 19022]|uniref:Amino acid ABC transporter substrate-binding protein, PAAT family (TC 3.A.1.3.-) n=2 Tax=Lutispora TaxID=667112 RepID=A0A1M6BF68_9FIRM|nr:amino acid ABC transporter substrate-binding protein, PAAT family (TC 3.A.1.3.-) [Lutispora thermophila DSM 19022]